MKKFFGALSKTAYAALARGFQECSAALSTFEEFYVPDYGGDHAATKPKELRKNFERLTES
jgi:hypothetical protein